MNNRQKTEELKEKIYTDLMTSGQYDTIGAVSGRPAINIVNAYDILSWYMDGRFNELVGSLLLGEINQSDFKADVCELISIHVSGDELIYINDHDDSCDW